jgi:hypothetical protein
MDHFGVGGNVGCGMRDGMQSENEGRIPTSVIKEIG